MAKKSIVVPLIISLILLLVIAGAIVYFFDIGGLKGFALSLIGKGPSLPVDQKSPEQIAIEKENDFIKTEKAKLSALRTDLENYRTQLDNKNKELEDKENDLRLKMEETEKLENNLSAKLNELTDLIGIYDKIEAEEAAAILSELEDKDQMVLIIKNLKKEKSAEILGIMDPKLAADILSRIY